MGDAGEDKKNGEGEEDGAVGVVDGVEEREERKREVDSRKLRVEENRKIKKMREEPR